MRLVNMYADESYKTSQTYYLLNTPTNDSVTGDIFFSHCSLRKITFTNAICASLSLMF